MSDAASDVVDLSARRAEALARVVFTEGETSLGPPPGHGAWRYRVIGRELQLRNKKLPHLRLDVTATEAVDLLKTLEVALGEQAAMPVVRPSLWWRFRDWLSRRQWNRKHKEERAAALRELASEFERTQGW